MKTTVITKSAKHVIWLGTTIFILNAFGQDVITNQAPVLATNSAISIVDPSNILPPPAPAAQANFILVQQGIITQPVSGTVSLQQTSVTTPSGSNSLPASNSK